LASRKWAAECAFTRAKKRAIRSGVRSAASRSVRTMPMPSFTATDVNSGTIVSLVVIARLDGTSIRSFWWRSGSASTCSTKGSSAIAPSRSSSAGSAGCRR
jgi:hypothetical protein